MRTYRFIKRMIGDEMFTKKCELGTHNAQHANPISEDAVRGFRMINYLIHLFGILVFTFFVVLDAI